MQAGALSYYDIASWSFAASGPVQFTEFWDEQNDYALNFPSSGSKLSATSTAINEVFPTGVETPNLFGNGELGGVSITFDDPQPNGSAVIDLGYDSSTRTYTLITTNPIATVVPVPLPATAWLLLSALGGAGALARMRDFRAAASSTSPAAAH
jgi:hypothetical protein